MATSLVLVGLLLAIFYLYCKYLQTYWLRKGVFSFPASFPFGHSADIILRKTNFGVSFKNLYQKVNERGLRYVGYYFFTKPTLVVVDLDMVKSVLITDYQHFTDHGVYCNEEVDPINAHLFTYHGEKWKKLRTKLSPAFTSEKLKRMLPILLKSVAELKSTLKDASDQTGFIEAKEIFARFAIDVIGSTAFGIDCNSLRNPHNDFLKYGKKVFHIDWYQEIINVTSMFFPQLLTALKIPIVRPNISRFYTALVKETVKYREDNDVIRNDLMNLLIQLKNNVDIRKNQTRLFESSTTENKDPFTMRDLTAQAYIFLVAGFETTSGTLSFCFHELACNQEVQKKAREHVLGVLGKYYGILSYESLKDMTYLDQIVQETLRKHPHLPFIGRKCTKDYFIPNTDILIPEGTAVLIPMLGIHYDPEIYPNPEVFDPERFSPDLKGKRHPCAWMPFSEGPRICIGKRFAWIEMKAVMAVLLKHFRFTLNHRSSPEIEMATDTMVYTSKHGIYLNLERIEGPIDS